MSDRALPEGWQTMRLIITGRVQGVSYRDWTVSEASRRQLHGWVRNRRDGTVEALFSGPAAEVDAMVEACRVGPPAARVTDVRVSAENVRPEDGFRQASTL
jgi:acylphosphatase